MPTISNKELVRWQRLVAAHEEGSAEGIRCPSCKREYHEPFTCDEYDENTPDIWGFLRKTLTVLSDVEATIDRIFENANGNPSLSVVLEWLDDDTIKEQRAKSQEIVELKARISELEDIRQDLKENSRIERERAERAEVENTRKAEIIRKYSLRLEATNERESELRRSLIEEESRAEKAEKETKEAKELQVKYQTIVYDVCNVLDKALGRCVRKGTGTTTGRIIEDLTAIITDRDRLAVELVQARGESGNASKDVWRCYFCNFVTDDPAEAAAHFGSGDGEEALCVDWNSWSEQERVEALQGTLKELDGEREAHTATRSELTLLKEEHRIKVEHLEGAYREANRLLKREWYGSEDTKTEPPRRFPVQGGASVPWEMVKPHETQMKRNHGQTMEQLAGRGGLSYLELLMVLDDRSLKEIFVIPKEDVERRSREAHDEIERRRVEFEETGERAKNDRLTKALGQLSGILDKFDCTNPEGEVYKMRLIIQDVEE